jgi:hypothetical protein
MNITKISNPRILIALFRFCGIWENSYPIIMRVRNVQYVPQYILHIWAIMKALQGTHQSLYISAGRSGLAKRERSWLVFGRCSLRIPAWTSVILTEVLRSFLQFLQTDSGIVPRLCHGRSLKNTLQIIIHPSSIHSTPHCLSTGSVI